MPATTPSPANGRDLAGLRASVRGPIHQPGDAGYDDARTIWNGMHDLRPAVVVEPLDAADVERIVAPLRAAAPPDIEAPEPVRWVDWQSSVDEVFHTSVRAY